MGCKEKENNGNCEKKISLTAQFILYNKKTHVFHTTFRFHQHTQSDSDRGKVLLTNEMDFFLFVSL